MEVLPLARELRSSSATRTAIMSGKNVSYIKGHKLVHFLVHDAKQNSKMTEEQAARVGEELIKAKLVIKADMLDAKKKMLRPCNANDLVFEPNFFYVWNFEGSTGMRNLLLLVIVLAFFGLVLFPVWPQQAKVGVWYVSMTLLLVLFGFICFRLALFLVLYSFGVDLWILPNFFADDLGIVESFRPLYSLSYGLDNLKQTYPYRLAIVALLASAAYWIYTQPTEFEEFVMQQRQFVDELYEGTLLSDKSQKEKDQIDRFAAIPDAAQVQQELDELEKMTEEEAGEDEEVINKLIEEEEEEVADL